MSPFTRDCVHVVPQHTSTTLFILYWAHFGQKTVLLSDSQDHIILMSGLQEILTAFLKNLETFKHQQVIYKNNNISINACIKTRKIFRLPITTHKKQGKSLSWGPFLKILATFQAQKGHCETVIQLFEKECLSTDFQDLKNLDNHKVSCFVVATVEDTKRFTCTVHTICLKSFWTFEKQATGYNSLDQVAIQYCS